MNNRSTLKSLLCFGLLVQLAFLLADSRSYKSQRRPIRHDSMVAQSTDRESHSVEYVQQYQPQPSDQYNAGQQHADYIPYISEPTTSAAEEVTSQDTSGAGEQYVLVEQPADQSHSEQDEYVINGQEVVSQNLPREPAQVIYIDQNGHQVEPSGGEQTGDMAHMASILAGNAPLAATILTEVPEGQMPVEVLNKLKREYGVKVVATRTHPGANLVINCDDINADSTVCASRQPEGQSEERRHQYHYQLNGYPETSSKEVAQEPATEQPRIPADWARRLEPDHRQLPSQNQPARQSTPLNTHGKTNGPREQESEKANDQYVYVNPKDRSEATTDEEKHEEQSQPDGNSRQEASVDQTSGGQQVTQPDHNQGFEEDSAPTTVKQTSSD